MNTPRSFLFKLGAICKVLVTGVGLLRTLVPVARP
jgi:hypothetical protein